MALAVTLASCSGFLDNKDTNKIQENEAQIQKYLTGNNLTATLDSSGLYYVIRKANPSGQKARVGDEASVYYKMYTLNGGLIDSTETSKNKPLVFPVGTGLLLPGMERAITLLRTGEQATFLLPYYLAWGNTAYEDIPAYSVIRIEMELAGLRSESQQVADYVKNKELVVSEASAQGMNLVRLNTMSGDTIGRGKVVKVNYAGKLLTGTEFDKGSLEFVTGAGSMIPGFDQGIRRMRVGEKGVIVFPSALGYGRAGRVNQQTGQFVIPPYAPLAFEVEVVSVKE
jgi:FKBP-type peptidyl-prolyl cis-trans isomerase